jgi:spectinomycin phosphotransferase
MLAPLGTGVLTPPPQLSDDVLIDVLARQWDLAVASLSYRPVGFGSHHWEVVEVNGTRWFVTVDDLEPKRTGDGEPVDAAFDRLAASLATAIELRKSGRRFVAAPIPTRRGEPVARVDGRFAVALYPFIDGQSFTWGDFPTPEHRHAVFDLIVSIHAAAPAIARHAIADDFAVPRRAELEAAFDRANDVGDCGPYAGPASRLVAENARSLRLRLAHYDELVLDCRTRPGRAVLTHGEPHPGNTMRDAIGWLLIDWDTVLVAPPERDLWSLDDGDGSILAAYADATGVIPLAPELELYRVRWDLADLASIVSQFRRHHVGSQDDDKCWEILCSLVESMRG